MKLYYLFSLFLMISGICFSQEKSIVYVSFDSNSNERCDIPQSQQGRYHGTKTVKKYTKSPMKDKTIDFYICNELFTLRNMNNIDTCSVDYLKTIKLSDIEELVIRVNRENPLYPDQVFDKIYLLEKVNDTILLKYDVNWKYYIE